MGSDAKEVASKLVQTLIAEGVDPSAIDVVLQEARRQFVEKSRLEVRSAIGSVTGEPIESEAKEGVEALIEEVARDGRSVCGASVSGDFWQKRDTRGGSTGFQTVCDKRMMGLNELFRSHMQHASYSVMPPGIGFDGNLWKKLITSQGATSAVAISPVYFDASRTQPMPLSRITSNSADTPQAYQLIYVIMGSEENPYRDPMTRRHGCYFCGCIILPEAKAREVYEKAKGNPRIMRELLRKMEPELMEEQEREMPPDNATAFIDGEGSFEWGERKMPKRVKPETIVRFSE